MAGQENPGGGRRSDWSILATGIGVGLVVIALLAAAYAVGHNRGRTEASSSPDAAAAPQAAPVSPAEGAALALFTQTCGGCHALAAAGTSGAVGPNLDDLRPTAENVLAAIENGGAGSGQMPPGLLQGADARAVAELVSSVAGK